MSRQGKSIAHDIASGLRSVTKVWAKQRKENSATRPCGPTAMIV
jgi:hypothetical protein